MGAATEMRNRLQIDAYFGGYVREFYEPPQDTFGRGNKRGQITDDFSLAYEACKTIVEHHGEINDEVAKEALLRWATPENYYYKFAGPTTKYSVLKLKGEASDMNIEGFVPANDNFKATNGSAMKIAPVALFSGGDVDKAIRDAITIAAITHPNNLSLSAAAAVSAATSCALNPTSTLYDVLKAGLYGARQGDRLAREKYNILAGASVARRIELAIDLGFSAQTMVEALDNIADLIGSGLMANEAVPAVFGIIAASKGDPYEGIYGGVNVGNDTDTVATMVGGILGTYSGSSSFRDKDVELLNEANDFDLRSLALEIEKIAV